MGWNMQRISIELSPYRYVLTGLALAGVLITLTPSHAGQQLVGIPPYSAVDPFDPSETVTLSLKDDIRLRLKLPEPDLPLSVVKTKHPPISRVEPVTQKNMTPQQPQAKSLSYGATEPGILDKSINTVMSMFDWSDENEVEETKAPAPEHSNGPIRINVHVGIKKTQKQPFAEISNEEISSLQTPWTRNQKRVRRLFTFGEIKTHD